MNSEDYVFQVKEKFRLSENFLNQFKGKQPDWGPMGYVTFKRTYARPVEGEDRLEEFNETLQRVIEGTYTIQLNHCKNLRLHWNAHKAQASAKEMFLLMWNFKFLPPGRGLWVMGTDVVWKKGGACLNNCGMVSTNEINDHFSDPFIWTEDMSMFGVGVGFDTLGADKVRFVEPKYTDTVHICEDSREGWCEIVRIIMDAYVGKAKIPKYIDYSEIRPSGAPIKTFGGIAPGPGPLIECVDTLKQFFNARIGRDITSPDIVDLMDIIGRCVVSGGVRRTALLALGNHADDDYMEMKDPEKYEQLLKDWRWASNNSICATVGMDYKEIAAQTATNGEPGFVWLDNIRKYGRLKDGINNLDEAVAGVNPCVTGDTLVAVADGRGSVRIDQLEDGALVYCFDDNGNPVVHKMMNPRITGYNKPIYKLTLDDGIEIKCTDNHKFRLKDGTYVQLKDLQAGDSLEVLTKYVPDGRSDSRGDQYISLRGGTNVNDIYNEHVLVAKYKYDKYKLIGCHAHHNDNNKLNNISIINSTKHLSDHSEGSNNPNYSGYSNKMLLDMGISLCKKLGRRFSDKEWKESVVDKNIPSQIGGEFRQELGNSISEFSKKCSILVGIDLPDIDTRTLRFYYDVLKSGYDTFIKDDNRVYVNKKCEACGKIFTIRAEGREQCSCSFSCNNKIRDYSKNKEGQKRAFDERRQILRDKQAKEYTQLQFELNRVPEKKEWVKKCKDSNISVEMCRKGSPFKSWKDLKEYASTYNHRVVSIEYIGEQDVWNGTVEDYHNFCIGGNKSFTKSNRTKVSYINCANCGEQSLESQELCNLVETFPSKHESAEEYKRTLKYAYLYAKTVTLVPTHNERTNQVLLRNRRIGLSMSGIVDAIYKFGKRKFLDEFCDQGYDYITNLDKIYSKWLCIPTSIKRTTTKPSGTVSLLAGVSPGIHWPHAEYYIRRMEIQITNPLIDHLKAAGYRWGQSVYKKNSLVFEFPIHQTEFKKSKSDVTIWEQLELHTSIQHYWSDNNVSQTVTFNPETESDQIAEVLSTFEDRIKAISFLPMSNHKYQQAPYEEITQEQFLERITEINPAMDLSNVGNGHYEDEAKEELKMCSSEGCQLKGFLEAAKELESANV